MQRRDTMRAHEQREELITFMGSQGWCLSVPSRFMITASSPPFALRLLFEVHHYPELAAHFVACFFFCGVVASLTHKKKTLPDCAFVFKWPVGHLPVSYINEVVWWVFPHNFVPRAQRRQRITKKKMWKNTGARGLALLSRSAVSEARRRAE